MSEPPHPEPTTLSVPQALKLAGEFFQAAQLDQTESICRQLLAARPNTHAALQLLGLVEFRRGRREAGVQLLRQALALNPDEGEYHSNLGVMLQQLNRPEVALEHYQKAVTLK